MNCPRCGDGLKPGDRFCPRCGQDVTAAQGAAPTARVPTASLGAQLDAFLLDALRRATRGSYDVLNELGRGGMAVVYRARDLALDREVAIKVMSPKAGHDATQFAALMARFRQEARTAARLSHLHIIPIYAVGERDDLMYFVMKYVSGRSLESVIKARGALPFGMVEEILAQVAGALDHAHRHGVIHRDIKPSNIMIDTEGLAVVTDFGIAKEADAQQGATGTGTIIGTPEYMSPEQGAGRKLTGAADQYSLGVAAYEMLTGRRPIRGDSIWEIMTRHATDVPAPVEHLRPDCPRHLSEVVRRMLEKEPASRFASLSEVVRIVRTEHSSVDEATRTELVTLAQEGVAVQRELARTQLPPPLPRASSLPTPESAPVKSSPSTPARRGRSRAVGALVATVVLAGGGLGTWQLFSGRTPVPPFPGQAARDSSSPAVPATREVRPAAPDTAPSQPVVRRPAPAASAPAPARPGRVIVIGLPRNGEVWVNDMLQSGVDFELRPGTYRVELRATGFQADLQQIGVVANGTQTVTFAGVTLPAAQPPPVAVPPARPDSGVLVVVVDPRAELFVAGGTAGYGRSFTVSLPAAAPLRVRLEREGYVTVDTSVTLRARDTLRLNVRLIRRN